MSARSPIGARRYRLTLEQPVDVPDDNGGVATTYTPSASLWARVSPRSMAEVFRGDQVDGLVTHDIVLRSRADLSSASRFRLGDRLFRVLAFRADDEKGVVTRALCEEIDP